MYDYRQVVEGGDLIVCLGRYGLHLMRVGRKESFFISGKETGALIRALEDLKHKKDVEATELAAGMKAWRDSP